MALWERNGSGKTVLMKMILGFIKPTSGTIKVNGKQVGKEIDIPDDIGAIIETPGFLRHRFARAATPE